VIRKLTLNVNDVVKLFCKQCCETYQLNFMAYFEKQVSHFLLE